MFVYKRTPLHDYEIFWRKASLNFRKFTYKIKWQEQVNIWDNISKFLKKLSNFRWLWTLHNWCFQMIFSNHLFYYVDFKAFPSQQFYLDVHTPALTHWWVSGVWSDRTLWAGKCKTAFRSWGRDRCMFQD